MALVTLVLRIGNRIVSPGRKWAKEYEIYETHQLETALDQVLDGGIHGIRMSELPMMHMST
jgi:hypothetical protein